MGAWFDRFACHAARWAGRPVALVLAVLSVAIWAVLGPYFHWSDTHQLLINTATTIVTFWLCFLIQASQNRDTAALHLKLDSLIKASEASNALMRTEQLPVEELKKLQDEL